MEYMDVDEGVGVASALGEGLGNSLNGGYRFISVIDGSRHYFFSHTFTFQYLDKPWSQMSSLLPPGSCFQMLSRTGFSNPTVSRFFIECC